MSWVGGISPRLRLTKSSSQGPNRQVAVEKPSKTDPNERYTSASLDWDETPENVISC